MAKFSGAQIDPHFVTNLLPCKRGIIATIMATSKTSDVSNIKAFNTEYAQYPLVRHGQNVTQLAKLSGVVGTPFTHISYKLTENKLYVFSAIDNLLKGAASQAVENFNRLLDLPLTFSHEGGIKMSPGPGLQRTILPQGFFAGGVDCGVRRYRPDLGLIYTRKGLRRGGRIHLE